ncbi:MAG: SH3 domain-containing protein [Spirochaetales bacterium]|nr:SH3 domain-containing protein [Spirochaetales bacterium]
MIRNITLLCGCTLFFTVFSCSRTPKYPEIIPPSSPVLIEKYNWAVCNTTNMHMYSMPDEKSAILGTIWKASVIEILSRSPKLETKNGKDAYWFRIRYNDLIGWVFGSFLKFTDTYDQAVSSSRGM